MEFIELLSTLDATTLQVLESADKLATTDDQKLLVHLATAVCVELAETRSTLAGIQDEIGLIMDKLAEPE